MKKYLGYILIIIIVIAAIGCSNYKKASDIKDTVAWLEPQTALRAFPFGTNPIYIYFYSEKSRPCLVMRDKIFNRPEIIEYMNKHITSIMVIPDSMESVVFMGDTLTTEELLKVLDVQAYPSHYFFTYKGELKGARTGYIKLLEFKQLLQYIGEGYFEDIDFGTYLTKYGIDMDTTYDDF